MSVPETSVDSHQVGARSSVALQLLFLHPAALSTMLILILLPLLLWKHRLLSPLRNAEPYVRHAAHLVAFQLCVPFHRSPQTRRTYRLALIKRAGDNIHCFLHDQSRPSFPRAEIGLLGVCRLIRAEVAPIFYAHNRFLTSSTYPSTARLNDSCVHHIQSLALTALPSVMWKYKSLKKALATEVPRLQNLIRLTIRFETASGMHGQFDLKDSIVGAVGRMANLKFLVMEGLQCSLTTQKFVDSIRERLGATIVTYEGRNASWQEVVIEAVDGNLKLKVLNIKDRAYRPHG